MEHQSTIIVHAETAGEAESLARETADTLCNDGAFSWVEEVGPAHEIDARWTGVELEENLPTILNDAPEDDTLAMYLRRELDGYEQAISAIFREAEESTTVGAEDVFAKEQIMKNFRRVGQTHGRGVYVYDQNGDGVNTARDLKYALSTGDYANESMIERGYRPFIVEVTFE